ncbi:hypothetical protein INT43_003692 [Umbelopsis isabellina]|uniref:Uncharacterized protein n=1 Tax=Mortierella isabellina TaxID=91625 RepID=A0A8H7PTN8_MORIS|nr:hypothetical protein INT43_003692 [Umbelopsis isabellina]
MTTLTRSLSYIIAYILIASHVIYAVPLGPLRSGIVPFAQTNQLSSSRIQQSDSISKRQDKTGSPVPISAYPHGGSIVGDLLSETETDKGIDYTDGNRNSAE